MLLLVTGGVGSGKSAYAAQWAMSLGDEAFRFSCPPFPDGGQFVDEGKHQPAKAGFTWVDMTIEDTTAATLHRINLESNFFRAERRVMVIDSLSGWLRRHASEARQTGSEPGDEAANAGGRLNELLDALLAFQGKRVVVTEEALVGLADDPWERWYARQLALAVRVLAEKSHAVYRLTAGLAVELKGHRVQRGRMMDESIYPNRR